MIGELSRGYFFFILLLTTSQCSGIISIKTPSIPILSRKVKGEGNKMDYEKIVKISSMIVTWEQALARSKERLEQVKEDVLIAEKNLNEWIRKLNDLLKEEKINE